MKYSEFVLRELTAGRLSKIQALHLLKYAQAPMASVPALHPLLHRNTSDFSGQRFSVAFSGDEFFLRDHVMTGRRLLPGVVCLEMARAAVARSLDEAATALELRDVTWLRPVVADDGVALDIELAVRDDGGIEFDVRSADGATLHVQGLVVTSAPADLSVVDIAGLRARCDRSVEASACYRFFSAAGLDYGPAHRGLTELNLGVDAAGGAFVLARVALPACVATTRDDYVLHPSVLDSALQAAVALLLGETDASEAAPGLRPMLPFVLERLQIAGPTPASAWVYLRTRGRVSSSTLTLDVDVCDEAGRVCVRLQGLTSRVLGSEAAQTALLTQRWEARPAVPVAASASTHWVCVDAAYAARLEALRASGVAARWLALPTVTDVQTLGAAWESVFALVREGLADQPTVPIRLQVLTARHGPAWGEHHGALLGAVSGLLKSAALENPLFQGQVIELGNDADAALLLRAVRENTGTSDAQVRYRGGDREVLNLCPLDPPAAPPVPWRDGGVYWITGGIGGLGLIVAGEILRHTQGARLVLTGRSAPDAARREALASLARSGRDAQVEYRELDVGDAAAVQACAEAIVARHGGLNAVVHSAGVIDDAFILHKTVEQLRAVWTAKVAGTVNLDRATRGLALDGFVLFSSVAGVAGAVGQSDYATANAFLDAYARYRAACVRDGTATGRTVAIAWPLWAEGGMRLDDDALQRLRQQGWAPLGTAEGLAALQAAWASEAEQVVVLNGTREALQAPAPSAVPAPAVSAAPEPAGIDADDLRDRTIRYLKQRLSQTLKLAPERIDADAPLERYGIDSILALKLVDALQEAFGALPKTLMFEYQTIAALAQYFLRQHRTTLLAQLRVETRPAPAPPAAAASLAAPVPAAAVRPRRGRRPRVMPSVAAAAAPAVTPIAIVGMSGRYPQAPTLEAYWQNLTEGRDCITEIPASRWDHRDFFDAEKGRIGKSYSKWGGFIDGVENFDALFFSIAPREAQILDPQERLFLQCAYETLEDAGYTRESLRSEVRGNVGVFVGVMYTEYQLYGAQAQALGEPYALSSSAASIANRVSYYCNLQGPSLAIDTMCSSSLTAIHLACGSLRSGECAAAIAGGVNVSVHPNKYLILSQAQFFSSRGRCESFGAHGDGYVPGEGVGAVLLKPLDRALAQGDHIYGLILGSSINHGGKTNGYSVPNPQAQAQVIAEALRDADVDARAISYVEAHGTGTSLGDPIEIAGLTQAFAQFTEDKQYCAIGSVKSNVGHLESAAGIAGLAKVLLQMRHGQLVPSLHAEPLNPHITFEHTPFFVQRSLAAWPRRRVERDGELRELPRIAGLSSFGAGGANAHLIVQEYVDDTGSQPSARPALVVLSARSEERLGVQVQQLLRHLEAQQCAPHELADLAYTLQVGREAMEHRVAFIATSLPELMERLRAYLEQGTSGEGCYRGDARRRDAVSLLGNDEELQQALAKWVERGKYGKLLELWVQGLAFDWRLLHADRRPRRLSLPTYPFAAERHWIPSTQLPYVVAPSAVAAAMDGAPPIRRRKRILHKQWHAASAVVEPRSGQRVLIVADEATRALALALQAQLEGSELYDGSGEPDRSPLRLAEFDGLIDLAGCAADGADPLDGLSLLQAWVQARAASGGMALGVTRGLERCGDTAVDPAGALRACFYRMLQSEYSRIASRHLDLEAAEVDDVAAQQIRDEYFTQAQDAQVCRRAGARYRAVLEETAPDETAVAGSPSLAPHTPFPQDAVLWITGGTRGLGYQCARHFVRHYGVRHLFLTCREPLPERASWETLAREETALAQRLRDLLALEADGASVRVSHVPLTDAEAVAREIAEVNRTQGPIAGWLHCAGRADAVTPAFVRKRAADVLAVLEPKVAALPVLFAQLRPQPLQFAALFSSVSAAVPALAAGQSDYAAANAFMDAYAEAQAQQGVPVVSIQWPSWAQSGMGAVRSRAYERSGLLTLDDDEGLALLDEVLAAHCRGTVLPAWTDERRWPAEPLAHRPPEVPVAAPRAMAAASEVKADAAGAATGALHEWLRDLVADHLGIERSRIRTDAPLTEYGADSVMLAQLLSPISQHVSEALDPSILYEHPTIEAFGGWLLRHHGEKFASAGGATPVAHAPTQPAPLGSPAVLPVPAVPAGRIRALPQAQDIAVVGLSCRFAGCDTAQDYWSLLCDGRSAIAAVPESRWGVPCDAHAALLDDLRRFDARYFRLSPADARAMDPQALLVLEEALKTWYDAGYIPADLRGTATGVYLGARSEHRADRASLLQAPNPILATGQNYLAANVSQFFDLRGPSLVVDTACSSALVAMDVAIQALQSGRTTAALVGGVNVLHTDAAVQMFRHRGLLQGDGSFHVFDRRAGGAVLGEGVGMVLLKTVDQAQADGDRIYAVVKAVEINNDGRTAGPSAPNVQAQIDVMRGALRRSGLAPDAVTHVEANGAGSEVNDLLELKALAAVYGGSERLCELGSMKPNIGHPLCAEGIASFLKVVLMLHHGRRVPFLSAQQPLQHFDVAGAGLGFCRSVATWEAPQRAAAINSFADGGTNAHVVVQAFGQPGYVARRQPLDPPRLERVDLDAIGPAATVVPISSASASRNFWKKPLANRH